jgi:cobalt transporter subunit CbtA
MLRNILAGGLVGGILGGAIVGVVQGFTTGPLILHAETFEVASAHEALVHFVHAHGHAAPAEHAGDFARFMLTLVATIAVATGYAWMLLAAMVAKGAPITARSVIPWAAAAFFAVGLAPAFGLPPELPGAAAADLSARQLWWLFTAVSSAGGLAAIFLSRTNVWVLVGIVALALPHLVGAPHPDGMSSSVPAELAAQFVSASLVIQLLMWIGPGVIAGYVVSRQTQTSA